MPEAKANLCFSLIHSVTSVQDELISQKMALGDAGSQQTMRKILIIGKEEKITAFVRSHTKKF